MKMSYKRAYLIRIIGEKESQFSISERLYNTIMPIYDLHQSLFMIFNLSQMIGHYRVNKLYLENHSLQYF